MATEVGKGYVDIVPDMSGFQDRVGREVEQAASKASRRAEKALKFGAAATAGLTVPIVAGFGAAISQASELEQSVGAVESVFGDASDTIFAFGDTSADSFGLAREEVNRLGAVVGAQLKGMGIEADAAAEQTVVLQQRAADLAATFGGTTAEAIQAISSLLRGERDPIERYGVSLKQADIDARIMAKGLDTSTVAAEKQATATAALELLLEGTADAAGQFARESETLAGQQARAEAKFKDAAAALGTELLPIATDAIETVSGLIDVFAGLPDPVQKGIIAVGGVAAAIGPISLVTGGAIKGIQGIKGAVDTLRKARVASTTVEVADGFASIGASAASSIPSVGKLAGRLALYGAAAAGVGAAADALTGMVLHVDDLSAVADSLDTLAATGQSAQLQEATGGIEGIAEALGVIADPSFGENVGAGVSRTVDLVGQIFTLGQGPRGTTVQLEQRLKAVDDALAGMVSSGNPEAAAATFDLIMQAAEGQGVTVEEAMRALPGYADALDTVSVAAEGTAEATEEGNEATEESARQYDFAADAMKKARQAHEDYTDQLRAATDPVFALHKAIEEVDDAQQAYNDAVEEYGPNSDEARAAALDLAAAVSDAEQAAIDGDLSFDEFSRKLDQWVAQGAITADQADRIRERVAELRGEAEDYSGEYTAYMLAETGTAAARINALREELLDITGRTWTVTIDQQGGRVASPTGGPGGIPERAGGGPLDRGQLAVVGEQGPELWVAGASGQVVSHERSVQQLAAAIVDAASRQMPARNIDSSTSSTVTNIYVDGRDRHRGEFADLRYLEEASR